MIPLFDSLTHPTISGTLNGLPSTFDAAYNEMKKSGFSWACAVGLDGVENYEHNSYIKECSKHKNFIPIAGLNPRKKIGDLQIELKTISQLGFRGIKIHPRNSNINLDFDTLPYIFQTAKELNLIVFLCTYSHANLDKYPESDPLYSLVKLLKSSKDTKVVLLHGGDVNLLQYAELVKRSPNTILDLSFTIMKYQGSSLDLDIKYLFKNLDRRICLGTDHPEFSHKALRERFEYFATDLVQEKKENIGYKNLVNLFNIME